MNAFAKCCIIYGALLILANNGFAADQRAGGSRAYGAKYSIGGAAVAMDTVTHTLDLNWVFSDSLTVIAEQDSGTLGTRKIVLQFRDYFKGIEHLTDDSLTAWSTPDTIQGLTRKVVRFFKGYGTHKQLRFRTTPNDSAGFGAGTAGAADKIRLGIIGTTNRTSN